MATTQKQETREEINEYELLAFPVTEAVELAFDTPPQRASLILGPPGIGKTTMIKLYAMREAEKLGKEFIDLSEMKAKLTKDKFNELVKEIRKNPEKYYVFDLISFGGTLPEELMGYPQLVHIKDGDQVLTSIEMVAFKATLDIITVPNLHGTIVLDDVLNAHDPIRKSFVLAVFNERVVGGMSSTKISSKIRIIATGNLMEFSELAEPVPKPMAGRAQVIFAKPPSLEEWYQYMEATYKGDWFKDVYAFLTRYPQFFSRPELINKAGQGPTPRNWDALAHVFQYRGERIEALIKSGPEGQQKVMKMAACYVGFDAASHFAAFLAKPYVSVDEVLADPKKIDEVAKDLDVAYRFSVELSQKLTKALEANDKAKVMSYMCVLKDLTDKTTGDLAVFVYDMIPNEFRIKFKKIVMEGVTSSDPRVREAAIKIRGILIDNVLGAVIIGK